MPHARREHLGRATPSLLGAAPGQRDYPAASIVQLDCAAGRGPVPHPGNVLAGGRRRNPPRLRRQHDQEV